jgi:hypothetical protein
MFDDRLGITLKKMDELECLMRGLEFVLQHVVGECYTYKPDPKAPTSQVGRAVSGHPPTSLQRC